MKRAVSLAFVLFFLLVSGGIQILVHTCGDETTVEMMPTSGEDPCGCGDESSDSRCCTVELGLFHLDEMQQPVAVHVPGVGMVALSDLLPFQGTPPSEGFDRRLVVSPPSSVSPTILNCTFLV